MARYLLTLFVFLGAWFAATPVHATKTGDLFEDQGIAVQNRPEVPSDQYYGWRTHPDMFPGQQPIMRTDKDMFDFMPVPGDPGIEKHFSAHMNRPAPDGPLFNNPNIPKQ